MPGLLERALHRRISVEPPRFQGGAEEDEGVTADERAELVGEIERLVFRRTILDEAAPPAKSGRKSGAQLPVVVNIATVLLLAGGILVSLRAVTISQAGGTRPDTAYTTTEGLVVQQVQKQASRELSAREQQIATIQGELARLTQAGHSSGPQAAAAADARRIQLEAELAKLRSQADVQLASLSQTRQQQSFLVSQLRSIYQNVGSRFAASDFSGALSGVTAADQLLAGAQASQAEASSLATAAPALLAGDEVLRTAIEYGQSAFTAAGPSQDLARKVTEIDQLVRQGDARFASGDLGGASTLYTQAISVFGSIDRAHTRLEAILKSRQEAEVGGLSAQIKSLQQSVADLQAQVAEQNRTLTSQREQISAQAARIASQETTLAEAEQLIQGQKLQLKKRTDELAAVVASLKEGLNSLKAGIAATSGQGDAPTTAELTDLLNTKVTLREAVDSSAVRAEYPSLHGKLDSFFRRYGEVYRNEGAAAALGTLSSALNTILTSLQAALPAASLPEQSRAALSAAHDSAGAVTFYLSSIDGILAAMLPQPN